MKKADELRHPHSCINRAAYDEMVFVLLARDPSAAVAVRAWVQDRLQRGKNVISDPQITEALKTAAEMERFAQERAAKR